MKTFWRVREQAMSTTETTADRARWRLQAIAAGAVLAALVAMLLLSMRDGDERVVLRSSTSTAGAQEATTPPETVTTPAPTTSTAPPTTTTTAPPTTTTAPPPMPAPGTDPSAPVEAAPAVTSAPAPAAPAPAPAPTTTTAPAPTTGTLHLAVAPTDAVTTQVWVTGPAGQTVLPTTTVSGPITVDGLAPGSYEVFIETIGEPSGPDENGVSLGGGSTVSRHPVQVTAGGTTTVR